MIIKEEYTYSIDGELSYTLIDNVDKIDVGCDDKGVNFIKVYKRDRKSEQDFSIMRAEDTIFYVLNDQGKTLNIIRPAKN